jgi:hypothetical protein
MQRIQITESMLDFAAKKTKAAEVARWKNKDKSVTGFRGRRAGFLGEAAFCETFNAESKNTFNMDAILKGKLVEIKTKRNIKAPNVSYWEGTVPGYSEQNPDYFAFLNIKFAEQTGRGKMAQYYRPLEIYFGGVMSYEDYLEKRFFVEKGETYSTNPDAAHTSQWNVYWRDLKDLSDIA